MADTVKRLQLLGKFPSSGGSVKFDTAYAGQLVYISEDGSLIPLALGKGLEIVEGVLTLTGAVIPPDNDETNTASATTATLGVAKLGLVILGKE